jgi:hypothetical protein
MNVSPSTSKNFTLALCVLILSKHSFVFKSHTNIDPSWVPLYTTSGGFPNAIDVTIDWCPFNTNKHSIFFISHIRTVLSDDPLANIQSSPSVLKHSIDPLCPLNLLIYELPIKYLGFFSSSSRFTTEIVLSIDPVMR